MRRVLVLAALGACVDQGAGPPPKKIDPAYVAQHLVPGPPPAITRLDVGLGGRIVYLGNTADATPIAPGQTVRITHYWKVLAPIGPGWKVFGLLRGVAGQADFVNLAASDMQLGHPPGTWKAGEIIEDVQDFTLRPDWRSRIATLSVGLVEAGQHGVGDRMATTGAHTQDRAVIARVFDVDLSKAPAPPGTVYVPRASAPIAIDGVAGEAAWASAATSPELVASEGSPEPVGKAIAKLTWDDEFLYAFVSVTDSDVVSPYSKHDDPLWKADCVELFIDADSNRKGYVELQVNPNNATFDSWFQTTRAQPGDPSWDSGMQTAVKLRGTTAPGDTDQGWDAELAIPWQAVRGRDEAMAVRLPPQVGDRWRLNVVRVDVKTNDKGQASEAWNRISSADYHALDRMLTVVFADRTGSIQPEDGEPGAREAVPGKSEAVPGKSEAVPGKSEAVPGKSEVVPLGKPTTAPPMPTGKPVPPVPSKAAPSAAPASVSSPPAAPVTK